MTILADVVDHVIGVDPDRDSLTAAVVDAKTSAVLVTERFVASGAGYDELVAWADGHRKADERLWAVEGTGSYGAGITRALEQLGEWVVGFDRPTTPARRDGAKTDALDAVRAARETLGRDKPAQPRAGGVREALRVLVAAREAAVRSRTAAINGLKALVVTAPEDLRAELRGLRTPRLVARCERLRDVRSKPVDHRTTRVTMRRLAQRVRALSDEIAAHEADLRPLVEAAASPLLAEHGIAHLAAAQLYVAWSHPGRCRSEAAFASLAGAAPIPASSGQTTRYRLNRGGDRQLNRILHMVVVVRCSNHAPTRAYVARRVAEGKTRAEARRCLKRFLARRVWRLLEHGAGPAPTPT